MNFEDSKLPDQPDIRKAFAAVSASYANDTDAPFAEGVWEARFLAENLADKNPVVIGAALALPMVIDLRDSFFFKDALNELSGPVRQALDILTDEPGLTGGGDGLNGLAMVAYRAQLMQGLHAANLANRVKIQPEMLELFDTAVEARRTELLEKVMEAKTAAPALTAPFVDSEPKLVAAFNAVVDGAVRALSPAAPAAKPPVTPVSPAP